MKRACCAWLMLTNKAVRPMLSHEALMRRAIELSLENVRQGHGGPFGAVIARDGAIVGESANRVTLDNDPTAHAEVSAIRDACRKLHTYDLTGCVIYTSCEPCPMCLGAIYWAHLDKMFYANSRDDAAAAEFDDALIYNEIPKPVDRRRLPAEQLLRNEALVAFREWQVSPLKIAY